MPVLLTNRLERESIADTCSEHYCLYPININGNISYECILKHRKFSKYDSFVSILFNVNHEEDIAMHSFTICRKYMVKRLIHDIFHIFPHTTSALNCVLG
jgi:hypothetical protein